jgi:FkbM family methyltransferase
VISYAQNAEDVVLARLFAGQPTGRYVDIGAGDPVIASVTKHFYDLGWRGVNIEPIPSKAEQLREGRPGDVNLAVAVGAKPGKATLHVVVDAWGWSTLDDRLAAGYTEHNDWQVDHVEVELVTLADVLDEHPGPVDFLKIDVEGAEQDVIEGADWARHRPRVIVVEATEPGSPTPVYEAWEPVLLKAGYCCALFDGLNRFYVQTGDDEARARLAAPANVFDDFERFDVVSQRQELEDFVANRAAEVGYARRLERSLEQAAAAGEEAKAYIRTLEDNAAASERRLNEAARHMAALEARVGELEVAALAATRYITELENRSPESAQDDAS